MRARNRLRVRRLTPRALGLLLVCLTAPSGFRPAGAQVTMLEAGGLPAEAAALLMSDQQGGLLTIEAGALPLAKARGAKTLVNVMAEIQGEGVLEGQLEGEEKEAFLQVFAYAVNNKGALAGSILKVIRIRGEESFARVAGSGVKFVGSLALAPGEYSVRFLARNPANSNVGLRSLPVLVPSEIGKIGESLAISPPLLPQPEDSWIEVRAAGPEAVRELYAGTPSMWPVVVEAARTPFEILTHSFPTGARLTLEIREQGNPGAEIQHLELPILERQVPARGWTRISSELPLEHFPAGDYLARVTMSHSNVQRSQIDTLRATTQSSADMPIFISNRDGAESMSWAQLLAAARGDDQAIDGDQTVARGSRLQIPVRELEEGMHQALFELAEGRERAARIQLTELEEKALGGSGATVDTLQKAELKILRQLSNGRPDGLAPVVKLFADLYDERFSQRRTLLSTHSRMMLGQLADFYVNQSRDDASALIAASALVRVGASSGRNLSALAETLYEQALALDPSNEAALLCLATGLERGADYHRVTQVLEDLLDLHPGHAEGMLRLAINLNRTGSWREAGRLLERLLSTRASTRAPDNEDSAADRESLAWVRAVAHQEWASWLLARDQPVRAREAIEAALEEFPHDEKLRLLLAFTLDRERRPRDAISALDEVPAESGIPSPRHLYGQEPAELVRRHSSRAAAEAEKRRPDLRTALQASGPSR